MKIILAVLVFGFLAWIGEARAQQVPPPGLSNAQAESSRAHTIPPTDDAQQLRADVQQLKTILNQMRSNLAFVQTTQSPLKHQFELDVDAWQVIVTQMERRLERMEKSTRQ